jgi:cytochrome d ubiquinol oxidase subunit I
LYVIGTGDFSAKTVAKTQPMKMAAAEGLFIGSEKAPLLAFGILTKSKGEEILKDNDKYILRLEVPFEGFLSYMIHGDFNTFVPGVKDLVEGNEKYGILSYYEKIERGYHAQQMLKQLKSIKDKSSPEYKLFYDQFTDRDFLDNYFKYFGYGAYYDTDPLKMQKNVLHLIPNIPLTFYAFHTMVGLGILFLIIFIVFLYLVMNDKLENKRWLYIIGIITIPLANLASQSGWIVAEVGRQPWVIQDLMPTISAVTKIGSSAVKTTFILFAITFTALLIAEIKIMLTQIKKGPSDH